MTDREILTGRWGGQWEFYSARYIKSGWHQSSVPKQLYRVRSVKTGYITEMREDSFV